MTGARTYALCALSALWLVPGAASAISAAEIQAQYELARYGEVISLGKRTIIEENLDTKEELEIRRLMAFSYVALGLNEDAAEEFAIILSRDPDYTLDPVLTSPKIVSIFESAREIRTRVEVALPERYDNSKAAMRSVLLPGLGQIYKGEKEKGILIIASEALLLGATVYCHSEFTDAHRRYLDAIEPSDVTSAYQSYNNWYRARLLAGSAAAAVWLYSHIDAALNTVPKGEGQDAPMKIGFEERERGLALVLYVSLGRKAT